MSYPAEVRIAEAGLRSIEAGSFVSPKWVPQMADTAAVLRGLRHRTGVRYPVLVPNLKGLEQALGFRVEEIAVFAAASEPFSNRNIRCSIEAGLQRSALDLLGPDAPDSQTSREGIPKAGLWRGAGQSPACCGSDCCVGRKPQAATAPFASS